ncbi:MAG: biotin/lipoyl-containing protein, partial [Planctomycetota bacterium]
MPTDIVIPQLGESITEAVIASWLVADGSYVERDQEIVELETDKVTMPLPSPAAGVITFGAEQDDTVEVGANIGTIDESAEKPAGGGSDDKKPEPAAQPKDE